MLYNNVDQNQLNEIVASEDVVLLKFGAPWCGPCKVLDATLEDLAGESFAIAKVNVDDQGELAGKFGVMSVPTCFILKGGDSVHRFAGAKSASEIKALIGQA